MKSNVSLLITGSSGFLGTKLLREIIEEDISFKLLNRTYTNAAPKDKQVIVDDFRSISNPTELFDGVNVLVHCAARVHVMNDSSLNPIAEFRAVNTEGTLNLAKQAASNGVKRFIFISTIKVNGEGTTDCQPYTAFDDMLPVDPYGTSKAEAEEQLISLGKNTDMEIVVIRPPLVYGEGVKANFASLLNLVSKGIPLPFECINNNKRSLVSVTNLVDLIITCIDHPSAGGEVFLVSDDRDVSTSEIVRLMAKSLSVRGWQLPVPIWFFRFIGKITGKKAVIDRLVGSLQLDISHTKDTLDWAPPQTIEQAFLETAKSFLKTKNKI